MVLLERRCSQMVRDAKLWCRNLLEGREIAPMFPYPMIGKFSMSVHL